MDRSLPLAAWHLMKRVALHHPPKLIGAVAGFFVVYTLLGRLRSGHWGDSILLSVITTALLVFVVACLYLLVTRSGFHFPG